MFDPMSAPPPASPAQIRAMEQEVSFTVQWVLATAGMLYLSPFVVDAVSKMF